MATNEQYGVVISRLLRMQMAGVNSLEMDGERYELDLNSMAIEYFLNDVERLAKYVEVKK